MFKRHCRLFWLSPSALLIFQVVLWYQPQLKSGLISDLVIFGELTILVLPWKKNIYYHLQLFFRFLWRWYTQTQSRAKCHNRLQAFSGYLASQKAYKLCYPVFLYNPHILQWESFNNLFAQYIFVSIIEKLQDNPCSFMKRCRNRVFGAGNRTWTCTALLPLKPESSESANSFGCFFQGNDDFGNKIRFFLRLLCFRNISAYACYGAK